MYIVNSIPVTLTQRDKLKNRLKNRVQRTIYQVYNTEHRTIMATKIIKQDAVALCNKLNEVCYV